MITKKHEEIKKWIQEQNGKPAIIDRSDVSGERVGIRIDFKGKEDDLLLSNRQTRDIGWEEFFKIFDEENLTFIYDDNPRGKDPTLWYRFARNTKFE